MFSVNIVSVCELALWITSVLLTLCVALVKVSVSGEVVKPKPRDDELGLRLVLSWTVGNGVLCRDVRWVVAFVGVPRVVVISSGGPAVALFI